MRIISTIVATLMLFIVTSTPKASADTMATNTNTNISNEISLLTPHGDPFFTQISLTVTQQETTPVKTEAEIKYEQILAKWKTKQASLWEHLPTESFTINASAYTAAADECGKSNGITASGIKVQEKRTLACPSMYPFGMKVAIEGYGVYTCEDRGGAIKGNHFDVYTQTKKDAFAFGRRQLVAKIVE